MVFASLVPDLLDENCPQAFKDAVQHLLCPADDKETNLMYRPYSDIPYTALEDPMEDNLRNRLMMFIGKFSVKCQENMKKGKSTPPQDFREPEKNTPFVMLNAVKHLNTPT